MACVIYRQCGVLYLKTLWRVLFIDSVALFENYVIYLTTTCMCYL